MQIRNKSLRLIFCLAFQIRNCYLPLICRCFRNLCFLLLVCIVTAANKPCCTANEDDQDYKKGCTKDQCQDRNDQSAVSLFLSSSCPFALSLSFSLPLSAAYRFILLIIICFIDLFFQFFNICLLLWCMLDLTKLFVRNHNGFGIIIHRCKLHKVPLWIDQGMLQVCDHIFHFLVTAVYTLLCAFEDDLL